MDLIPWICIYFIIGVLSGCYLRWLSKDKSDWTPFVMVFTAFLWPFTWVLYMYFLFEWGNRNRR